MKDFFRPYFERLVEQIWTADVEKLSAFADLLGEIDKRGYKAIFAGNGGSAAMAAHVAVDLTKVGGVRAVTFNEVDLITCFANDYGYEQWVARALEFYADPGDVLILVSSSGRSPNMLNAAKKARELGLGLVTFTGFASTNPLRTLGDLNFWVESDSYNIVEMAHHVWLLAAVDCLAERRGE